jgi:hypothetical protein
MYCTKQIAGTFNCSHNNITTLRGCPKIIFWDFNCSDNKLKPISIIQRSNFKNIYWVFTEQLKALKEESV